MPESEQTKTPKAKKPDKQKRPKDERGEGSGSQRSASTRVERSLKNVDRLLKKNPETPPQELAMAQLEQAKVLALLQLADAIRESKKS